MLKGLAASGLQVSFISLNTKKHFVDLETFKNEFSFLHKTACRYIDTDVKPLQALINLFGSKSYNIERFVSDAFREDIQRCLDQEQYDIVHFEGLYVAAYAGLINCSAPKLLRQHNIEYKIWQKLARGGKGPAGWYMGLLARRLEHFEKDILRHFSAVVCISEDDRQVLDHETPYKGPTYYLPAGFEVKTEHPEHFTNYKTVYHIGSMEWMPNQEAMKWFREFIWPLVEAGDPEAEFHMAGKHMPAHCSNWNSSSFRVHGEVPDMDAFVSDKSILAVPLRSGSGIRIKTIEAMLSGKAVVSTGTGAAGIPLTHGENCLLADDPQAFAESILKLLADPVLRDKIAQNGKQLALELYGNAAISEKWKSIYASLVY